MASNNPIIDKLRKLIAHEQSARAIGSILEAEAFADRIQALLNEYKLSMSEIEFEDRDAREPIDWELVDGSEINVGGKKVRQYWRQMLANTIAATNSCHPVGHAQRNAFSFVGRTTDRELCKMLYLHFIELGETLCRKSALENKKIQVLKFNLAKNIRAYETPDWAKPAFRTWMKDFCESWKVGFATALSARLQTRYDEATKTAAGSAAMVHIKKDALAVEEFLEGKIKKVRGCRVQNNSGDGYSRGHSTGSAVNLNANVLRVPSSRRLGA